MALIKHFAAQLDPVLDILTNSFLCLFRGKMSWLTDCILPKCIYQLKCTTLFPDRFSIPKKTFVHSSPFMKDFK